MTVCLEMDKAPLPQHDGGLAFFIVVSLLSVACVVVWVLGKNRYDRTRIRPTSLVITSALGTIFTSAAIQLYDYLGHLLPCWTLSFLLPNIVPFVTGSITMRLVIFYFHAKFSDQVADLMPTAFMETDDENMLAKKRGKCTKLLFAIVDTTSLVILEFTFLQRSVKDKMRYMHATKFILSAVGTFTALVVLGLPFAIASVVFSLVNRDRMLYCYGCALMSELFIMFAVVAVFAVWWNLFIWYRARKLQDTWGFRNEASRCLIFLFIAIIIYAVALAVPETYAVLNYVTTIFTLLPVIENSLVQLYLAKQKQKHMTIAELSDDSSTTSQQHKPQQQPLTLDQILANPRLERAFENHLKREYGMESLLFLRDVKQWQATFYDISVHLRQVRAAKLCALFIDSRGLLQVNLPDTMANDIKRSLARGEDVLEVTVFDPAIVEIKHLLASGAVRRFQTTREFTVAMAPLSHSPSSRRSTLLGGLRSPSRKDNVQVATFET
ncbi:hypothetical protein BASA81_004815 [Batrachochytrium salamandrivorans]|nr:hypothetical protein BASA81_004815 [Batrachochytrium salamandrivorans]